jgi:hypothetical protein
MIENSTDVVKRPRSLAAPFVRKAFGFQVSFYGVSSGCNEEEMTATPVCEGDFSPSARTGSAECSLTIQ